MKVVVKLNNNSKENLEKTITHLFDCGYLDLIVFTSDNLLNSRILEKSFELGANIVTLKSIEEGTFDILINVKGSLIEGFLMVYSHEITKFNLKDVEKSHRNSTLLSTLLLCQNKTVAAFFEPEIFDYMTKPRHFEKEVIPRIFEDGEVQLYS